MITRILRTSPRRLFISAPVVVLALLLSAATGLHGQLQWKTTVIEESLELGQEKSEAVFRFENKGTYPVVIRSTNSSCGCTTAELTRTTFYPGDKGEITAQFEVGNRTGTRRNTIQVQTNDPMTPSTTLTYAVTIPSLVTITPRLVHWRAGEEPDEKIVNIKINPEAKFEVTGVEVDNEEFQVVLLEDETPYEYQLKLTPLQINSRGRAIISLQTEPEMENQRNFSFYAYVR